MNSTRNRIMQNIRGDVRAFLRHGTPIPARDSKWEETTKQIMEEEKRAFAFEQELKVESIYKNYHKKHVTGISYEEWLDKAKKLYSVDASFTVHSIALGPDNGKQWACKDLLSAHKKVIKLISYKHRDHFVRGRNFAYDPDSADA